MKISNLAKYLIVFILAYSFFSQDFVHSQEKKEPSKKERPKISLNLKNADINTVLGIFSKETGISIIAGRNVYGNVTLSLNDVDAEQALAAILKANGYSFKKEHNIITIISAEDPVRIQKLPDGTHVSTFIVNYIEPENLRKTMVRLLPTRVKMYTTEGNNTLVVKGYLNDIRRAETMIKNIDIPPKQVMVETKIIEVSLNDTSRMGVNLNYTSPGNANEVAETVNLAGSKTDGGAQGLYYSITNTNPESVLEALSTRTGFNILSSPKVIAMNDEQAEIITGSRLGYKVKTITETGFVEDVEFLDVGTKLVITPSIKSDGRIIMSIHPEISEGAIVNGLPQKNSTETTTKVIVKNGQTIIIGGLVRNLQKKEVTGVPILMDIPLLGAAFKRTELTSEKKEVIILLTPHIINTEIIETMEKKINDINAKRRYLTPHVPTDLIK